METLLSTIPCIWINLTKEFKIYTVETLVKEDIKRLKILLSSCIDRTDNVKRAILPNATNRVNEIQIKTHMTFFTEIEKKNLEIYIEAQKILKNWSNHEGFSPEGIYSANFTVYFRATVIKTVWRQHQTDKVEDQTWAHTITTVSYLTKIPNSLTAGNIECPANGAGKARCLHAEKWRIFYP